MKEIDSVNFNLYEKMETIMIGILRINLKILAY
jgi:hypothetical protein